MYRPIKTKMDRCTSMQTHKELRDIYSTCSDVKGYDLLGYIRTKLLYWSTMRPHRLLWTAQRSSAKRKITLAAVHGLAWPQPTRSITRSGILHIFSTFFSFSRLEYKRPLPFIQNPVYSDHISRPVSSTAAEVSR